MNPMESSLPVGQSRITLRQKKEASITGSKLSVRGSKLKAFAFPVSSSEPTKVLFGLVIVFDEFEHAELMVQVKPME